ncbi:hypothetical protein SLS62_005884 [Diatrype stigma]|uniref:Ankyrin n=1 Tax=Diatrype stigma TaxID=117547 RepID=A0AAN9UU25_9PEZI
MATIRVHLPAELVENIAEHIPECPGLAALARSSKSLYAIVNPILYVRATTTRKEVLLWAVMKDRIRTTQLALDAGAKPEWCFEDGIGPTLAIYHQVYGEPFDPEERHFLSALHAAVLTGRREMLELLLKRAEDPDCPARHDAVIVPETPLHVAICLNNRSIAELLLRNGASVRLEWDDAPQGLGRGLPALTVACLYGSLSVAKLLVEQGYQTDVNIVDYAGRTPLACAFIYGQYPCFDWLLSVGADVNIDGGPDSEESMLMHACKSGRFRDACRLIDLGVDVNARAAPLDRYDMFEPLRHILQAPDWSALGPPSETDEYGLLLMRKLIENGVDPDIRKPDLLDLGRPGDMGMTPLGVAARMNNTAAAELLLSKGARLDAPQGNDASILMISYTKALRRRNLEMVKLLLKAGADVHYLSPNYGTALEQACLLPATHPEKLAIIRTLLEYGAKPVIPGRLVSALSAAFMVGDPRACELIVAESASTLSLTELQVETIFRAFLKAPSEESLRIFTALDPQNWIHGTNSIVYRILEALRNMARRGSQFRPKPDVPPPELVMELLDGGTCCDYTDDTGHTALTLALEQKCTPALVRKLLEHGVDPNQGPRRDKTPLAMAIRRSSSQGQHEVVELLMNAGAKGVHQRFPGRGDNVLILAIRNLRAHPGMIDFLLGREPLTLYPDTLQNDMITAAFHSGKYHVIQILMEAGKDVRVRISRDPHKYLHVLLGGLRQISVRNQPGVTAWAMDEAFACLEFLLKLGADLSTRAPNSGWVQIYSIMRGYETQVGQGMAICFSQKLEDCPDLRDGCIKIAVLSDTLSDRYGPSKTLEAIGRGFISRYRKANS